MKKVFREWIDSLRLLLIMRLWPNRGEVGACANRRWRRQRCGAYEMTLEMRFLNAPDGYAREELYEMLCLIRKHEAIMGWKVPEPEALQ